MDAVTLLKQDHKQVAALFKEFEKAAEGDKESIAGQVCEMLTVHAQIEEELLYPAARDVLKADDEDLVDEATVEHASVKDLVAQIETADSADDLFDAKVKVLGEYVTHHVKEEETELFPKLQKSTLDLEALGTELAARKAELMGVEAEQTDEDSSEVPQGAASAKGNKKGTLRRAPARD